MDRAGKRSKMLGHISVGRRMDQKSGRQSRPWILFLPVKQHTYIHTHEHMHTHSQSYTHAYTYTHAHMNAPILTCTHAEPLASWLLEGMYLVAEKM